MAAASAGGAGESGLPFAIEAKTDTKLCCRYKRFPVASMLEDSGYEEMKILPDRRPCGNCINERCLAC
ncbi:MAG: hypothetical protein Hyperionvirus3_3 [Hyperionvirus sp.]|uniref:Uncharacterized protein n=1 Tax=Hyperionvirus sp. TaxID=2487770 RepID=A0A3G5A6I3_9VIRU|nr:MAG: hypothetical protein Hyperionvirus3_3 [Hyperionvirus sp.]